MKKPKLPSVFSNQKEGSVPLNYFAKSKGAMLETADSVFLLVLFAIGIMSRVFKLQYPQYMLLKESEFGYSLNQIIRGQFYIDSNPPLPKLIVAGVVKFAGYDGRYEWKEGNKYPTFFYIMFRLVPSVIGGLCVPLIYLIMRAQTKDKYISAIASLLVAFETRLIYRSRYEPASGISDFFAALSLLSIFYFKLSDLSCLVFGGICFGLALSCRVSFVSLIILALYKAKAASHRLIICGVSLLVYFSIMIIFLTILPYSNDILPLNLPKIFRNSLVDKDSPDWNKRYNSSHILIRSIVYQKYYFTNLTKDMNWIKEPFLMNNWRIEYNDTPDSRFLVAFGNPLIYFAVILCLFYPTKDFVFGYFLSFFFSRDYSVALIFGILNLALALDSIPNATVRVFIMLFITQFSYISYTIWNPLVYGLRIDDMDFLHMFTYITK